MHTRNPILNDAVDSFRRKVVWSVIGTACVIGAAGTAAAYGFPDVPDTRKLKVAFATLHAEFAQKLERRPQPSNDKVQHPLDNAQRPGSSPSHPPVSMPAPVQPSSPPAPAATPRPIRTASVAPDMSIVALSVASAPRIMTASVEQAPVREIPPEAAAALASATPDPFIPPPSSAKPFLPMEWPQPAAPMLPVESTPAATPPPAEAATPVVMPPEAPKVVEAPKPPPPPPTPAEQLGLKGKDRVKAERCLAQAIYFEARNEPVRGQIAVAQVVMNRVFSPYYPKDVCSVVFQNAHRFLSCQFTFACDGHPETIRERGPWSRAQRIAKQTLDAKVWLNDVAKSTHYHAVYVRPVWVREMKKMARYGLHMFYRPHNWGDGANEAGWVKLPEPKQKEKKKG